MTSTFKKVVFTDYDMCFHRFFDSKVLKSKIRNKLISMMAHIQGDYTIKTSQDGHPMRRTPLWQNIGQ